MQRMRLRKLNGYIRQTRNKRYGNSECKKQHTLTIALFAVYIETLQYNKK